MRKGAFCQRLDEGAAVFYLTPPRASERKRVENKSRKSKKKLTHRFGHYSTL